MLLRNSHKKQFNRCVDELDKLNIETRKDLEIWFEEQDAPANERRDMFHYDGYEDDFEAWGSWYQWGLGECNTIDQQGFSTGLLANTPKVELLANRKKYDEVVKQWANVMSLSPLPAKDLMDCFWDDQASGHNYTPDKTFIHKNDFGCEGLNIYDWSEKDDDRVWFNLNRLP
jgi:hypothetical protein